MRKITLSGAAFLLFMFSGALSLAGQHTPVERGKTHFNNPSFAGGTKPCAECHPGGEGLEAVGLKQEFSIAGGEQNSLEEAINVCIVNANKGEALAADSTEMQELASYIRSLKDE